MQVVAAGDRQPEGLQQLRRLGLLQHVAARAGPQRLAGVLGVLAHRQDRDRERGVGDEALRQRREARAARHRQVEREQVGLVLADRADRGGHVAGFGHDAELARLALEHHADAVAHDPVVVRDDHVDRSIDPWCASLHRAQHSTASTGGSRPWRRRPHGWEASGTPEARIRRPAASISPATVSRTAGLSLDGTGRTTQIGTFGTTRSAPSAYRQTPREAPSCRLCRTSSNPRCPATPKESA